MRKTMMMNFVQVNPIYFYAVRILIAIQCCDIVIHQSTGEILHGSNSTAAAAAVRNNGANAASIKDAVQVIKRKCEEYANARFKTVLQGGMLFGQKPKLVKRIDCVQTQGLIYGGEHAKLKEFPHMALIGYGDDIDDITWACGGSLISDRFILSAAHCTHPNTILNHVKWAALGFLKRDSLKPNTLNKNIFRVSDTFNHPGYDERYTNNDIALYKLESPISFAPSLRPICLPTSTATQDSSKQKLTVTGWGKTSADEDLSDTLLKTGVYFVDKSVCSSTYSGDGKLRNGYDPSSMICAGNLRDGNDTCAGDSGGPIQVPTPGIQCMFTQIGITSYGSAFCGNKVTPAVYTRVSNYLPWIRSVVWPA